MMANQKTIEVTLVKSVIGRIQAHRATVTGLGLRRLNHTVLVEDTPAIRGMINAVSYLLRVSEANPVVAKKSSKAASPKKESSEASIPKKYLNKAGADDLTVVEGIGPKISEILAVAGISTFKQLAGAKVSKIEEILKAAGSRYALANPGTWPEQAALLADGKFEDFEKLAKELDGGVRK